MKLKKFTFILKQAVLFILFQAIFFSITVPLTAFYGPFERVKQVLVKSAMETGSHQYIAKVFLSQAEINKIIGTKEETVKTTSTDTSTFKPDSSIEIQKINSNKNFDGYVMLVHDPKRVKVGYSIPSMDVDVLASKYGAVAAINGGAFSMGGLGKPGGFIISDGKVQYSELKDYNVQQQAMAITGAGKLLVGAYSINDLLKLDAKEALCFGPALIVDGKVTANKNDELGSSISPRTAIGQKKDGTIILLVIGERSLKNYGATFKDVEDIMLSYGAVNAFNLDGGGSTSMFYNGEYMKLGPTIIGRSVPSIIYVK